MAASSRLGSAWAQTAAGTDLGEGYATGDGARLYFVRSGDGPVMLIIGACFFLGLFDVDRWNAQELAKASTRVVGSGPLLGASSSDLPP